MKKERVERILKKGAEQKNKYLQKLIGTDLEIVPEHCIDGITEGYSENYIRLYVDGEIGKQPTHVRVESVYKDGLKAVLIKN